MKKQFRVPVWFIQLSWWVSQRKFEQWLLRLSPEMWATKRNACLLGFSQKAKDELGWEPKITFEELIKLMVDHDINATQKLE